MCIYIYIYIVLFVYVYIYIYRERERKIHIRIIYHISYIIYHISYIIYIYIYRERESERDTHVYSHIKRVMGFSQFELMSADRWATWEIDDKFDLVKFDKWKHYPEASEITYTAILP